MVSVSADSRADAVPADQAAAEPHDAAQAEGAAGGDHDPLSAGAAQQLRPPAQHHGRLREGALTRLEGEIQGAVTG